MQGAGGMHCACILGQCVCLGSVRTSWAGACISGRCIHLGLVRASQVNASILGRYMHLPLVQASWVLEYFFLFSFSLRLLLLTHFGESPVCENVFPPIFWHNQRIYPKKIFFSCNFCFTFYGQRLVTAAWATRSPRSILFSLISSAGVTPGPKYMQSKENV